MRDALLSSFFNHGNILAWKEVVSPTPVTSFNTRTHAHNKVQVAQFSTGTCPVHLFCHCAAPFLDIPLQRYSDSVQSAPPSPLLSRSHSAAAAPAVHGTPSAREL